MSLQHELTLDNSAYAPETPHETPTVDSFGTVSVRGHIPRVEDRLSPRHLAKLRASGLTDDTILAAQLRTSNDPEKIAKNLNWTWPGALQLAADLGPCLAIPFIDQAGNYTGFARYRPDNPRVDDKGKCRKYESQFRGGSRLYIPPGTRDSLFDPARICITEGLRR